LSGVAAFTNVLNVVLVIRGKLSSFFWGIVGAILYGIYAFAYGYVGDAQLYVLFFLPMQFVGIYIWSKQLDNQATTRVKSLKLVGWLFVIALCAGLGVLFYFEIPAFAKLLTSQYFFEDNFVAHLFDASTNAFSVVAQFLLILCYWEQYILWLVVNIIGIIMYSGKV
jgi:nicotinamide mononucleotide transporter